MEYTASRVVIVATVSLVLVGCAPTAPAVFPATSSTEATPSATRTVGSAVTLPVEPRDYGIYRDAITRGNEAHAGSVEAANYMASCLSESGFSVTVTGPGEMTGRTAPEQGDAYNIAFEACLERAAAEGVFSMRRPDEATLRLWYRAYVEVAYECLNERGYPTTPPPSEDVWVQDYGSAVWHPHDLVWSIAESLEGACSQDIVDLLVELGRRDTADGAP